MIVVISLLSWITGVTPEELRAEPEVMVLERIAVAIVGPDDEIGPRGGESDGAGDDGDDGEGDDGKHHDESPGSPGDLRPFGFVSDIYNGF
jgi:hypothetical protein